jgi:predicted nucleotidyltransferase
MPERKLFATLQTLCQSDIQFIVVGGLAAVLNGAPVQTYDIDLLYSREQSNVDRLLNFLQEIDAIFRIQPERRLRPTASHLAASGHLNLLTRYGPVDLLGTIGQNLSFSDLLPHSDEMDIGEGIRVRVLNLETLISIKEQLASEKDLAVLPILRQTLREMKRKRDISPGSTGA